jgi:CheY-like chemotaxis protein
MSAPTPQRVLVVEDDAVIRGMLVDFLELEGYTVRSAADGSEALAVLGDWPPDLILLDLMMPRMDGWQFRAAQRALPGLGDVPVVVLSAGRDLAERTAALAPAAVIRKPFDLDEVLTVLHNL